MRGQPNDLAWSQLVGRLDAPPVSWLLKDERCTKELRAKIMNNLAVTRAKDGLFIRHKGDTVRAVLSDEYTRFDNVKFIDLIGQAIEHLGYETVVLRPVVGDHLSAYILMPQITFNQDPNGHGGLHPAVYVSNSEVGTGAARTAGGLYLDYCENGSIHGWKAEEALAVRHRFLSVGAMRSIVASGIAGALKMSEQAAKDYVAAQDIHLEPVNLKGIVDKWATKYGLTVGAKENWLAAAIGESSNQGRKPDPRVLDLFNGATYSAKLINSVPERELVERMAGDMLTEYGSNYRNGQAYINRRR